MRWKRNKTSKNSKEKRSGECLGVWAPMRTVGIEEVVVFTTTTSEMHMLALTQRMHINTGGMAQDKKGRGRTGRQGGARVPSTKLVLKSFCGSGGCMETAQRWLRG